jgi:hypothetical protein
MTRAIGLLLGLGLIALAVLAGQVAGGHAPAGSAVTVSTLPTGEIGLSRSGPILVAPELHPGRRERAARTGLIVANQTGRTLAVRMRLLPSLPDLDRLLMVSLELAGERPVVAPIGDLRRWTARPLMLLKGESRRLVIRTWVPAGVRSGYQGRIIDVDLEFRGAARGN